MSSFNQDLSNIIIKPNHVKLTIENNFKIEEKLNVIIVISNPCLYKRRYYLANQFIKKMQNEPNVELYVVELTYNNQKHQIAKKDNPNHLLINTDTPIWHKENMVNLAVKYLLPKNWKAVAWIDADVEFDSTSWAEDALKLLNGSYDVVQLFSHAIDMDIDECAMSVFSSFAFNYVKGLNYCTNKGINYWHPGYAWACTRNAYENMGGLFETAILGSGDWLMAGSFISFFNNKNTPSYSQEFKNSILRFQKRVCNFRLGYTPGIIRHFFHGSKINRNYQNRNIFLMNNKYNPELHITIDEKGLIIPSKYFPEELKNDILMYFKLRNEDECF